MCRIRGNFRLKATFVLSSLGAGGAERVAAHLVNEWAARDEQVMLILTYSEVSQFAYSIPSTVTIVALADIPGCRGRSVAARIRRLTALRRALVAQRSDVVISFLTDVNVATLLACIGLRVRVVVSERTHPPLCKLAAFWRSLRWLLYRRADRIVMLSQKSLVWLQDNIPDAKGVVIPNPVVFPLPEHSPVVDVIRYVPTETKLIVGVGRLDSAKQFDHLLRAFAASNAHRLGWHLVILGNGPCRNALSDLGRAIQIGDQLHLPGSVGNMGAWYARADIFVMTSSFEGFPNALVEAMSYGVPPIAYDCDTGPSEIIDHQMNGILVRPTGNELALSAAITTLVDDEDMRHRMGNAALSVRQTYSPERVLAMWDEVLSIGSN